MSRITKMKEFLIRSLKTLMLKGAASLPNSMTSSERETSSVYVQDHAYEPVDGSVYARTLPEQDTIQPADNEEKNVPAYQGMDEVSLTRQNDFKKFAEGISVPKETIEKWIAAGVLYPDEIRAAEKLVKVMRERDDGPFGSGCGSMV